MGARRGRRRSRRRGRRPLATALALLALVGFAFAFAYVQAEDPLDLQKDARPPKVAPPAEGVLRVHYVDVGAGDGTVWELPDGSLIVYDCGPPASDAASNPLVRYLEDVLGRREGARIHALVSSHGHLDHVGGCDEVFERFEVERVVDVWYEGADATRAYGRFKEAARAEGATILTLADLAADPVIPLPAAALANGTRAEVLWPVAAPQDWDRIAEASIVVRLTHGGTAFCFQGDIEREQEREIAQMPRDLACDAYLVGHHGSRYASDPVWLSVMDPSIAVVSFGENTYGHPTSEALCRVQLAGATVYATHRTGDVVLESDGVGVRVAGAEQAEAIDYCADGASYG